MAAAHASLPLIAVAGAALFIFFYLYAAAIYR